MAQSIKMTQPIERTECRVLYGDTDSGGVVYYGNYLRYYEAGRTEFMRRHAVPYRSLEDRGIILPVVECYSRYKASARYDDLIMVETSLAELHLKTCRFNYRIVRSEDDRLLVKGFTLHAVVNRQGRLTDLPEDIYNTLTEIFTIAQTSP